MSSFEDACALVQQHLPKHTAITIAFNQHITANQNAEDFYDPRYWINAQEEVRAYENNSFWTLCYTMDDDPAETHIYRMFLASDLFEAISYALTADVLPVNVVH